MKTCNELKFADKVLTGCNHRLLESVIRTNTKTAVKIVKMVTLKRAVLTFSGVCDKLHRIVVMYPKKEVSEDVVLENVPPQKLLKMRVEVSV